MERGEQIQLRSLHGFSPLFVDRIVDAVRIDLSPSQLVNPTIAGTAILHGELGPLVGGWQERAAIILSTTIHRGRVNRNEARQVLVLGA